METAGPVFVLCALDTLPVPVTQCSMCARVLDDHDRHLRFTLPQPVLDAAGGELPPDTWFSHDTPRESVMMQVPQLGAFVRALLPIKMVGGHALTYGVWLAISPADLQHLFGVWWTPDYANVTVSGLLANPIPPWGMLGAQVDAIVRDADQTPWCAASPDPMLQRALTEEWPHDVVLGGSETNA